MLTSSHQLEQDLVAWALCNPTEWEQLSKFKCVYIRDAQLRMIYKAAADLVSAGECFDISQLRDELAAAEELEIVGGVVALCELVDANPNLNARKAAQRIHIVYIEDQQRQIAAKIPTEPDPSKLITDLASLEQEKAEAENGDLPDEVSIRFSQTSLDFVLQTVPPQIPYLIESYQPAGKTGLMVGRGGGGKGFMQCLKSLCLATGEPFGPFSVPVPRGTLIVSYEENREDMHRRFHAAANVMLARAADKSEMFERLKYALSNQIKFVSVSGLIGVELGQELLERIVTATGSILDHGLTYLDPIGRFRAKDGTQLNQQEGAASIISSLDAITVATGQSCIGVYHVSKFAMREGQELQGGASSGSQQLEDLARWVENLAPVDPEGDDYEAYGLDSREAYVQIAVSKTNYTPPMECPMFFRRGDHGAFHYVPGITSKRATYANRILKILVRVGRWMSFQDIEREAKGDTIGPKKVRLALDELSSTRKISTRETTGNHGGSPTKMYAPAENNRPEWWAD